MTAPEPPVVVAREKEAETILPAACTTPIIVARENDAEAILMAACVSPALVKIALKDVLAPSLEAEVTTPFIPDRSDAIVADRAAMTPVKIAAARALAATEDRTATLTTPLREAFGTALALRRAAVETIPLIDARPVATAAKRIETARAPVFTRTNLRFLGYWRHGRRNT